MKTHYEFIYFTKIDPVKKIKTEIWECRNLEHGFILGEIRWRGSWRQYCFFPDPDNIFNRSCLNDIADFIKQLMEGRKHGKAKIQNK